MFKHEKQLFHPVAVEGPNPHYAALLQEQLGGGNGELKAAMQYMSQSFRIKDQEIKDLFLDIAAEELGHMEMVAQTINLLNGQWSSVARTTRCATSGGRGTRIRSISLMPPYSGHFYRWLYGLQDVATTMAILMWTDKAQQ